MNFCNKGSKVYIFICIFYNKCTVSLQSKPYISLLLFFSHINVYNFYFQQHGIVDNDSHMRLVTNLHGIERSYLSKYENLLNRFRTETFDTFLDKSSSASDLTVSLMVFY